MKSVKIFLGVFLMALLFIGCDNKDKSGFEVHVTYKNASKMPGRNGSEPLRILLEEIPFGGENRPVLMDSVSVSEDSGEFTLKGGGTEEAVYELLVENGPLLLLVNDEDDIDVTIDLAKKDDYYSISGSPGSLELKKFIEEYSEQSMAVNLSFQQLDSLKQLAASDSLVLAATGKKNSAISKLNSYLNNFIANAEDPAVSLFALGMSSRSLPSGEFEGVLNEVVKKFPENKTLAALKSNYDKQKEQSAARAQKAEDESWIGKQAPDLFMPGLNGDTLSISSFKGKYLLVDFWASWCGPCRAENPNLLKAYEQHKNKNFTVLGVSLDQSREAWIKAIKDDKLPWPQMSDLLYWDSKAVEIYHFQGIPFNVLIDPSGTIIAEGLRGFDLEKKLAEVLQ